MFGANGGWRLYTAGEIAAALIDVSAVALKITREGFAIQKISVTQGGCAPEIHLFNNDACQQLLRTGVASLGWADSDGLHRNGFFYQHGCRFVWSER